MSTVVYFWIIVIVVARITHKMGHTCRGRRINVYLS